MADINSVVWAVLIGIAAGIPIWIGFRAAGKRPRCWRCRVWMQSIRRRDRTFALLPVGQCEGCGIWCLALGSRAVKKKK